jgi:tryptophan-rich sensory protein
MKLIFSLVLCIGTGAIAGLITSGESSGEWFMSLNKPSFQPPGWVFGPVWTTLYTLMGVSLWLVRRSVATHQRNIAISVFFVQLVFNFLWSIIFFRWHMIGWALVDIIILWLLILVTIILFGKISRTAAWLLVPYFLWVSFAMVLNWSIWSIN